MIPKINSSELTEADLNALGRHTAKKIKAYVAAHPKCSLFDLIQARVTTELYLERNVVCTRCGYSEEKASYAIAQKAMGFIVDFNCTCGHSFSV